MDRARWWRCRRFLEAMLYFDADSPHPRSLSSPLSGAEEGAGRGAEETRSAGEESAGGGQDGDDDDAPGGPRLPRLVHLQPAGIAGSSGLRLRRQIRSAVGQCRGPLSESGHTCWASNMAKVIMTMTTRKRMRWMRKRLRS
jgi:hypothetical protein